MVGMHGARVLTLSLLPEPPIAQGYRWRENDTEDVERLFRSTNRLIVMEASVPQADSNAVFKHLRTQVAIALPLS